MEDWQDGDVLPDTEHLWPDKAVGPWRLLLSWQVIDGRPECVAATIAAVPDLSGMGRPLQGAVLRDLRIPDVIARARAAMVGPPQRVTLPPGMRRSTAERLTTVAEVYRKALRSKQPPVAAVAEHFGVSKMSASNMVARARAVGFLPPASPGVPVG